MVIDFVDAHGRRADRLKSTAVDLLTAIEPAFDQNACNLADDPSVISDIDALIGAFRLQKIRRYFHQMHWEEETREAVRADEIEPGIKLENVAAHSWHVADAVLLLSGRFDGLNILRTLQLAILHDKLEIYTGDIDPVGPDGEGNATHAFNRAARARKVDLEREALSIYVSSLRPSARNEQRMLLEEIIETLTREARFVKAIDKIQALAFVHEKKKGVLSDAHLCFSIRYTYLAVKLFRELTNHYVCLLDSFIRRIADRRQCEVESLVRTLRSRIAAQTGVGKDYARQDRADW